MNTIINRNYIEGIIIGTFIFFIYIEISPRMGNIWYRTNSKGKKELKPINMLNYIKTNTQKKVMWYPKLWDINYFIFVTIFTYLYNKIKIYIYERYI